MKSDQQNNADRTEKPWIERYRDEYEIPARELLLTIGMISDPAKIAEMNRLEGIRHSLMAELIAVKKANEPQTYPATIDECKELFEGILQKNDMLHRGEGSDDVKEIRKWRNDDYHPSTKPTLGGTWNKAARRLVELSSVLPIDAEQAIAVDAEQGGAAKSEGQTVHQSIFDFAKAKWRKESDNWKIANSLKCGNRSYQDVLDILVPRCSRAEQTKRLPRQQNLWVVFGSGRFPSW